MSAGGKFLSGLGWLITIPLQVIIGYLAGVFALGIARGALPVGILYIWLGITLGIFLMGALVLLVRRAIRPKKYLARLGFTLLGAAIPLAILWALGTSQGFDSQAIQGGLGLLLPILAAILGLVGFYVTGWFGRKKAA
jgi:hypothetical protein